MDETTWGAFAVVLTLVGGGYTYWAFQHRGAVAGTRGAALTLLPAAAFLTGTLRMFTRIVDAVVDWATSIVLSPSVWLGTGLAGLSFVLLVVARYVGGRDATSAAEPIRARRDRELPPTSQPRSQPEIDDELADIEALLKRRGIT